MQQRSDLYNPGEIRNLLSRYEIRLTKSLGQNFITSKACATEIVDHAVIGKDDTVIEIGTGLLGLTGIIASRAGKVISFEKDKRLVDLIKRELHIPDNVTLIEQDFLKHDLSSYTGASSLKIVANLPYSVSSQILIKVFLNHGLFKSATCLFQKELAERISSGPSSRDYGTLSVLSGLIADIEPGPTLGMDDFFPRPQVESKSLKFSFKKNSKLKEDEVFDFGNFLKGVFAGRRKKLINSLKLCLKRSDPRLLEILNNAGIDPGLRIEKLNPGRIHILYKSLKDSGLIIESGCAK